MIELVAITAEDGWAFFRDGNQTWLVRPPYRATDLLTVSAETPRIAIATHGFEAASMRFDEWAKAIDHLRAELVRSNAARPKLDEPARRLLQHAPRATLVRYLGRVETELLPQREWSAAMEILEALLELESVLGDAELRQGTLSLLKNCGALRQKFERERAMLIGRASDLGRFKLVCRRYGEGQVRDYQERIVRRGKLLQMAS